MKKNTISIFILTSCALYVISPFFLRSGFYFGSDHVYHINWAYQVSAGMKEGIIYPRWLSLSNGGYGSPTMIFYSPLSYWLTGFVNLFIPSIVISLKVITFAGFLMSGITMYIFLRNFCNHTGSVTGGVAYQLLPYHIFDLYGRGTLAETFAFLWLPLILHFAYKGGTVGRIPNWIGLGFSYAGLILTHIVSAYIFTFVIAAFAFFFSVKAGCIRVLLKFIPASLLGLSLSAVYFIPMFFERKFVHIEWMTEVAFGDYTRNFLFMDGNGNNSFYMQLQQIVLLQALLSLGSIILIYLQIRRQEHLSILRHITFFFSLFIFSLFISSPYSIAIWKVVPGLATIQFPWRWLMVSTLAAAVLVGFSFNAPFISVIKRESVLRISMAIFHALFLGNLYLSSLYILMTPEPLPKMDMPWLLNDGGDVVEYRPVWLTEKKKDFSEERRKPPIIFKDGAGTVDIVRWKSQSRFFRVNALTPSTVRVSTFYYPGWTAVVNDWEIPIGIEKDSGAMLLKIPRGENKVTLEFRDTPLRKTAKWISIISVLTAISILVLKKTVKMA